MFSKLHDRFGTAGLAVAVVALVAALTGTAFAAAGLNSQQKKEVKKIAKQYAGKPGPAGANGAPGAQGPQGAAGAAGKDGSNGSNGTDGTSATTAAYSGLECESGGVEINSASPTAYVCNGETGFTETMPSEATETGSFFAKTSTTGGAETALSFPIPLSSELTGNTIVKAALIPGGAHTGNGTVTEGSKVVTAASGFEAGSLVSGTGIPTNAFIAKKITNTELELSVAVESLVGTGVTETLTATARISVPSQCQNAGHPGEASAANPEATPGFLCVFPLRAGTGPGSVGSPSFSAFKPSGGSGVAGLGASTSGSILSINGGGSENAVIGTFAVGAP
jgi:hypothetical protein